MSEIEAGNLTPVEFDPPGDPSVPVVGLPGQRSPRRRARWPLLLLAAAVLLSAVLALPRSRRRTMTITGAGAGTYSVIAYERHYLYWVDRRGGRGVDTSFLVAYFSHERSRAGMLAEARRIAPALWPFADTAGLTRLELKPTRALLAESIPFTFSYDLNYQRQADGSWAEVRHW